MTARTRFTNQFSAYIPEVCATTTAGSALGAPSNVSVQQPARTSLAVWFNDNATNETGVEIERSAGPNGPWAVVITTNPLPGTQAGWYWTNTGLRPNTEYCNRMRRT